MRVRTVFLSILLLLGFGMAQTLQAGVRLGQDGASVLVGLGELQHETLRFSLRLVGGPASPLAFGVSARTTLSFGPIGNAQVEGALYVDTRARFDIYAQGAGTIGQLAASVRLELYNTNPSTFDLAAAQRLEARPAYLAGGFGISARGSVTYRLDRFLVIVAEPELHWLSARGLGVRLSSALQLRRLIDNDDGHVLLLAELEPGFTAAWAAAGFEYRVNRPDWPVLRAAALLGLGSSGFYPGLRLSASGTLTGTELGYSVSVSAEPYRTSEPRYRGSLGLSVPLGPGGLSAQVIAASGARPLGASLLYSYRF